MLYQAVDLKKKKHVQNKICEMHTVKLQIVSTNLVIVSMYRALCGNLNQLLDLMNDTLKQLCQSSVKFLLSGDINISYHTERERKKNLMQ